MSKKLSATVNNTETPTISCEIVNRVKDALFALDTNWNITYMNEAAGEYFNNNTETLLGKNFWQIFSERKIVFFDKYYDKALKNQEIIIAEEYSSLKNNWFEKRIYPSLTGLTIIIKDINEKKTADEKEKGIARKISELNTKFTKVFLENPIPLSLRDIKAHEIIDANRAMLEILDFKKEEFIGKQLNKISLVIDDNNDNVYYENFLTDQNLYKSERTIKTIKGKTINALVTRSVLAIEGRELALTSFVDITSVKAAEKIIIDSNKITSDFKNAIDQSAIVTISDIEGNITYVNDNFCKISQYERKEIIGKNHRIVNSGYHSKDFFKNLWKTLETGQIFRSDIKSKAKDGSFYWVRTTIVPLIDENGKPFQYVAIRYDITEEKTGQEKLLDQLEKLKEIAWIHSHMVRAPLAKIMGLTDLIKKQICTPEEEKELLNAIIDSSKELDDMIKSIVYKTKYIITVKAQR